MGSTLFVRHNNDGGASTAAVFYGENGASQQIGNAWSPALGMESHYYGTGKDNLAVQFAGAAGSFPRVPDLFAFTGGEIRKYNTGTSNWDVAHTPTGLTQRELESGLYVLQDSSKDPLMVGLYRNSTAARLAVVTYDGSSFANTNASFDSSGATSYANYRRGIVYRNTLFLQCYFTVVTYNGATGTFSQITPTGVSAGGGGFTWGGMDFALVNGRLFIAGIPASTATEDIDLWEYAAGAFGRIATNACGYSLYGQYEGNCNLVTAFGDPLTANQMIIIAQQHGGSGSRGLKAWKVNVNTLVVTDITTTVLPVALRHPNGGAPSTDSGVNQCWLYKLVDNTSPGAPAVTVLYGITDGGSLTYLRWNGDSAQMTSQGSGANTNMAFAAGLIGCGERQYAGATNEYHVEEVGRSMSGSNVRVTFRVYDHASGGTTVKAQIYYSTDEGVPDTVGTVAAVGKVSGPGSTPGQSGNSVTNLSADNESVYYMDWNATADGFDPNEPHTSCLNIDTT